MKTSPANIDVFMSKRPLLFDIETTGLKADYGLVLVIGIKAFPHGLVRQFVIDIRSRDMERAERRMLREFRDYMEGALEWSPGIITYNGTRFDLPFLQARLAINGLPLLPKMRHLDMFYTVKRTFGYTVTSRRAKYLQALYRVGDPTAPYKDSSEVMTWLRATFSRNRAAFSRIVEHNRSECLVALDYQVRKLRDVLPRTVALR